MLEDALQFQKQWMYISEVDGSDLPGTFILFLCTWEMSQQSASTQIKACLQLPLLSADSL